jgi:hypothetical protein
MADESLDFTIEFEPEQAIVLLRMVRVVLSCEAAIDHLVGPLQHVLTGLAGPHYLLVDITGLVVRPRMRTYLLARGRGIGPQVQAVLLFSQSDRLTELVVSTALLYDGVPFHFYPDEAAARSQVAALHATPANRDQLA